MQRVSTYAAMNNVENTAPSAASCGAPLAFDSVAKKITTPTPMPPRSASQQSAWSTSAATPNIERRIRTTGTAGSLGAGSPKTDSSSLDTAAGGGAATLVTSGALGALEAADTSDRTAGAVR